MTLGDPPAPQVTDEPLEQSDGYGLVLDPQGARAFAQPLLRTESAAELGHRARLADNPVRFLDVALLQLGDPPGDLVAQRTSGLAARALAEDAPLGLGQGILRRVPPNGLLEIAAPDLGQLDPGLDPRLDLPHVTALPAWRGSGGGRGDRGQPPG